MAMYKGAFHGCRFCGGSGCLACDGQRKKAEKMAMKPIFTAKRDNPKDMAALKRVFGPDALAHAYGPEGGGLHEIEYNAALESLNQFLRNSVKAED